MPYCPVGLCNQIQGYIQANTSKKVSVSGLHENSLVQNQVTPMLSLGDAISGYSSHWVMQYLGTALISGALTTYTTWSRHLYTRQCLPQKAIYPWHCFALLSKLSVDQAYFQISVELQKALPFMAISVTIIVQLASTLPLSSMPIAWHYIYHALAAYHLLPCVHMLGVPSRESLENTVRMIQKILEASS